MLMISHDEDDRLSPGEAGEHIETTPNIALPNIPGRDQHIEVGPGRGEGSRKGHGFRVQIGHDPELWQCGSFLVCGVSRPVRRRTRSPT
nr:hypothetical protein RNT25_04638 [arsenite-oxidising bacterium NT-25]